MYIGITTTWKYDKKVSIYRIFACWKCRRAYNFSKFSTAFAPKRRGSCCIFQFVLIAGLSRYKWALYCTISSIIILSGLYSDYSYRMKRTTKFWVYFSASCTYGLKSLSYDIAFNVEKNFIRYSLYFASACNRWKVHALVDSSTASIVVQHR